MTDSKEKGTPAVRAWKKREEKNGHTIQVICDRVDGPIITVATPDCGPLDDSDREVAALVSAAPMMFDALMRMINAYLYEDSARRRGDTEDDIADAKASAAFNAGLALGTARKKECDP